MKIKDSTVAPNPKVIGCEAMAAFDFGQSLTQNPAGM
jgi:hypothetical protein